LFFFHQNVDVPSFLHCRRDRGARNVVDIARDLKAVLHVRGQAAKLFEAVSLGRRWRRRADETVSPRASAVRTRVPSRSRWKCRDMSQLGSWCVSPICGHLQCCQVTVDLSFLLLFLG
jgi:hypothetical protein